MFITMTNATHLTITKTNRLICYAVAGQFAEKPSHSQSTRWTFD